MECVLRYNCKFILFDLFHILLLWNKIWCLILSPYVEHIYLKSTFGKYWIFVAMLAEPFVTCSFIWTAIPFLHRLSTKFSENMGYSQQCIWVLECWWFRHYEHLLTFLRNHEVDFHCPFWTSHNYLNLQFLVIPHHLPELMRTLTDAHKPIRRCVNTQIRYMYYTIWVSVLIFSKSSCAISSARCYPGKFPLALL